MIGCNKSLLAPRGSCTVRPMPLFRNKDQENDKLRAELERISLLPLSDLAAEVMMKGFGGDSKGATGPTGMGTIAGAFNPAMITVGIDQSALEAMYSVTAEGVQVLEHAGLVRCDVSGSGGMYAMIWTATRRGRQALEQNAVARFLEEDGR
jgi:hypothetical protein